MRWFHLLVCLFTFTLTSHVTPLLAQSSAGLFVPSTDAPVGDPAADATVARFRYVSVDLTSLRDTAATDGYASRVTLNLFDDATWVAQRDRVDTASNGFTWVGHIDAVAASSVTLSVTGNAVYGAVFTPDGTYIVRPAGGQQHIVTQVDRSRFAGEAEPPATSPPAAQPSADGAIAQTDDGSVVDVMVLYTPAAEAAAGGASAVQSLINAAISTTNTSYANSGVSQRLRLAYAGPVAYTETGGTNGLVYDLNNVTYSTGALAGVANLRDTYRADIVTLLTDTPASAHCGVAWVMQYVLVEFETLAFNVVEQSCAVANLTFAHELGHNMGLRHDWYSDGAYTDLSYAHGYVNTSARWRTVMAKDDLCAAQGFSCALLPYWSNPGVTYGGAPMGVPAGTGSGAWCTGDVRNPPCDADDHRALNTTAWIVSNFRPSVLTVTKLSPSTTFITAGQTVTWTARTGGGTTPYTFKFWVYDGSTWTVGQDWSPSNTFDWTPAIEGSYTVQAWARNAGSSSTFDAWLGATVSVRPRPPLTADGVWPSVVPLVVGRPASWFAWGSGGTAPYSYQFWLFDGVTWTLGRDWSTSDHWDWTPPAPGTYTVQAWMRNAGSTATYDAWISSGPYVATNPPPPTVYGPYAYPQSPVTVGTATTLSASATGGLSPYTYKLWMFDGATWSILQDWTTSMPWNWTPTRAGTYTFQVWVRNAGSSAPYDAWKNLGPYQVIPVPQLSVLRLQSDRTFPVPAGTPVRWDVAATGGTAPYTFRFYVSDGSTWTLGQDWSAASSWTWIPPSAGTYSVQAWARNAGSSATYDAWLGSGAIAIAPPAPLSVSTLSATPLYWNQYLVRQGVYVQATATGGTGPYSYRFYLYDGSTWSVGQDWNASNTWIWTPAATGTYTIQVWVRNAGSSSNWDAWKATGPITVVP